MTTKIFTPKINEYTGKIINIGRDKLTHLKDICSELNITLDEVAYMGDDLNDLQVIENVGFSACPQNAQNEIKNISKYICKKDGGAGCFREFATLILQNK